MNILLTGCNGFIGRYIAAKLLEAGHYVHGVGTAPLPCSPMTTYSQVDISSGEQFSIFRRKLEQIDILIHCAAYISYNDSDPKIMMVNAIGTHNLVEMAKAVGISKIVYCSSSGVIGYPVIHPITEDHPLHPTTVYHVSKLCGEYLVRASGIDYIIFRIPSPIGIGMNENTILPVLIKNCISKSDILLRGTGSRIQNYISIQDISTAILLAITSRECGNFNLSGECISNIALAELCKNIIKSESNIIVLNDDDPTDHYVWDLSPKLAENVLGFKSQISLSSTIGEIANYFRKRMEMR